ncbi:hypothetical protein [Streptomyces sp. NPDC057740]|uniref:hypothetical protein n=1 Tax=Streptomyces sp. NPDC057740 TaxID=3346234 RepID=UPI0036A3F518
MALWKLKRYWSSFARPPGPYVAPQAEKPGPRELVLLDWYARWKNLPPPSALSSKPVQGSRATEPATEPASASGAPRATSYSAPRARPDGASALAADHTRTTHDGSVDIAPIISSFPEPIPPDRRHDDISRRTGMDQGSNPRHDDSRQSNDNNSRGDDDSYSYSNDSSTYSSDSHSHSGGTYSSDSYSGYSSGSSDSGSSDWSS